MATTPYDRFHDDLMALLRSHGLDVSPDTSLLAVALYGFSEEVEKALDAKGAAHKCEHCSALVTRLYMQRDLKGGHLAVCARCHDMIDLDLAEINDPRNAPESEASLLRWANPGIGKW